MTQGSNVRALGKVGKGNLGGERDGFARERKGPRGKSAPDPGIPVRARVP